ncbi:hypothetical protein BKA82DRAFT_1006115 [Pisolithus tinctorius]|uniref:FAD/NAD(P)-binding domain-containing protein n=1 Tax=Pisolithus tinctorius Marx 270 TaxID=870435 RepID=A0A0C3NPZ2_PISTI|nr:hypothetical protein BKA82DRAFT_1006115 [Pisolithus tinctorius]KIN97343.1 hypothetical protein M404DRAFT_1006115 [Pisolithus tinctorius Marx 270]
MVDFRQLACSLLGSLLFRLSPPGCYYDFRRDVSKSVVIVGAGSAGLAMLKTLLDLPVETRAEWNIVLYEQRRDIGGIWLPDPSPPPPPKLPETPLYPLLHTDTPVPIMTYPHFPFPPGTPLFPTHGYIERYHQDYATHYGLWPYIKLNHSVVLSSWVGTPHAGHWELVVEDRNGDRIQKSFDHLVVAAGRYHEPHMVIFPGQDTWLENNRGGLQREILHSMWYRNPSWYANRTVVVVGGGPSGVGIASQVLQFAHRVYLSVRSPPREVPLGHVELKPEILHFTSDGAVFTDGSTVQDVDTVLLATGYDLRVPFLEEGGEVIVKPGSNETDGHKLATNLRYLFPLHQHIFSLSASYPTNALAFIGLPRSPYIRSSNTAQSIYATSIIANGSLLAPRAELLSELADSEEDLWRRGYDPYYIGHKMVNNSTFDYQEGLIKTLRSKEGLPEQNIPFIEPWRRESLDYLSGSLKRGWKRLEVLGLAEEWLEGVESEDEWADLMRRVNAWQRDWEAVHHLVFPDDILVYS